MPKVSSDYLGKRRQQIIHAAWQCFGENGFHQTTMRDICRKADLSPGAVYRYFDGKQDIIAAVAEQGRRAGARRITPADETDAPVDALAESVDRFLTCLTSDDAVESARIDIQILTEALRNDEVRDVVSPNIESLLELFGQLVRKGQERSEINSALSPEAVARLVLAVIQGAEYQRALDPSLDVGAFSAAVGALLTGLNTKPQ